MKQLATLLLVVAVVVRGDAQDKPKWDIADPLGPTQKVEFDTSEGTWMNVDVSPDGKHIVFDLLGDLYTMAIDGGTAARRRNPSGTSPSRSVRRRRWSSTRPKGRG